MQSDDRIVALESQVRNLKKQLYLFCGLFVIGGVFAVAGLNTTTAQNVKGVPFVVRSRAFEVVDKTGRKLVSIGANGLAGHGHIIIANQQGKMIVSLTADTKGAGMVKTRSKKGQELVVLTASSDGHGLIETSSNKDKRAVTITASISGDGLSKNDVVEWLHQRALIPLERYTHDTLMERMQRITDGPIPMVRTLDDLVIIVLGGPGKHSSWIPTFGGNTKSVTKEIIWSG